ncbi:MAG: putative oxidoreductase C-terminal domain-containing protein [Blastocatellia bacterium]
MTDTKPAATAKYKLMTLNPGHFHAALVQKSMNDLVSPTVNVYAPEGFELNSHLKLIEGYNTRASNPTKWDMKVYKGADSLEKMLSEKPGNVVVLAGNNQHKVEYIKKSVDAGLNVLSDKPMVIDEAGYETLKSAFDSAKAKNVLLYDIMTERYEITTMLQKELANTPALFGELQKGTPDDPAITKISVHHLYKIVSDKPLVRPAWFYDTAQQGEGIVDVTTHLVDLIFWECFPEKAMALTDLEMLKARRWATSVSKEQFAKSTNTPEFPDYLKSKLDAKGNLQLFSNGEFTFKAKGVHAKTSVTWNYEAPAGTGDTHFSAMKGTKAIATIKQGKEENYKPELYVTPTNAKDKAAVGEELKKAVEALQAKFKGVALKDTKDGWQIVIPESFRDGHESHFSQVAGKYFKFLEAGKLPEWEVPNMLAKYYVTTQALKLAMKGK